MVDLSNLHALTADDVHSFNVPPERSNEHVGAFRAGTGAVCGGNLLQGGAGGLFNLERHGADGSLQFDQQIQQAANASNDDDEHFVNRRF